MDTDERIKVLEARVEQLESELAKRSPKSVPVSSQRLVDDGRGRGIVVTVGGNN